MLKYHSRIFIFIFVVDVFVWLLLGWKPNLLMSGNDGISHSIIIRLIAESSGLWFQNLYDPTLLGGTDVHPTYGSPILYVLLSLLNLPDYTFFNLSWILFQSVLAFYVVCLFEIRKSFSIFLTAVFIGFLPLIGWRIGYGHQSFIWGALLPFVFLFYYKRKTSLFSHLVSILVLLQIFTSISPQMLLSSSAFLALFLLFEIKYNKEFIRAAAAPIFIFISCLLVSLPLLLDPLFHLSLGNSSRGILNTVITDSFYRQSVESLVRNLTPVFSFPELSGEHFLLHEIHYPWAYFLPVLFFWKRLDRFTKNILLSCLVGIFAVHAFELSGMTGPFKISMRFLIPFVLPFAAIFLREVLKRIDLQFKIVDILIAMIWIYILSYLPSWVMFFGFLLITALLVSSRPHQILLFIFIILSLFQFKSMLLPFPDLEKLRKDYAVEGQSGRNRLERSKVSFVQGLGPSTPRFLNVSAVDGYWLPNDRFNQLWSYFESKPYDRGRVYFDSTSKDFSELYNVNQFSIFSSSWTIKEQLQPQSFLEKKVVYFEGTSNELFAAIKENKNAIFLKNEDWVQWTSDAQLCKGIVITDEKQRSRLFNIELAEQNQPCIVFLPLNHSPFLQATAEGSKVKLFSSFANYAQFAVYVPLGIRKLEVGTKSFVDRKTWMASLFGMFCLFYVTLILRKNENK
jgi:hypothetical protein